MDRLTQHELLPVIEREKDPGQWSIATALAVIVSLADELPSGSPERRALAGAAMALRPVLRSRHRRRFTRERRLRGLPGGGGGGSTAAALLPAGLVLDQLLRCIP